MTATESPPAPGRNARRYLLATVVLLVTIALLYWVLRDTSLSDILAHLRGAQPLPLVAAMIIGTATFPIRAIRWRLLLRTPDDAPIRWSALWHATAIGFMANNTLPFRLGEVVRSYAGGRLGGVPFSTALSSIAVERALDLLTLVALLTVALFSAGFPADTIILGNRLDRLALKMALLCGVIFLGGLLVVVFPERAERIIGRLIPWPGLRARIVNLIEPLRAGLAVLRRPKRLLLAVGWSLIHWLLNGAAFYVAFGAFGIPVDFAGALLVQTLIAVGISAPSTPGYFGVFELVTAAALALYGVSSGLGFAYGAVYHVVTFLPIVLLGFWSLARTGLSLREARTVR